MYAPFARASCDIRGATEIASIHDEFLDRFQQWNPYEYFGQLWVSYTPIYSGCETIRIWFETLTIVTSNPLSHLWNL